MKRYKSINFILISILLFPILLRSQNNRMTEIGFNIPPLIGKTLSMDVNIPTHRLYSYSYGICGMINNRLPGKLNKVGEATFNHESSGISILTGIRFTPRKEFYKSYYFVGAKLIGGYFKQSAEYHEPFSDWFSNKEIPKDYYFIDNRVYSEGFFAAFAVETGINIVLNNKFSGEFGLQWGRSIATSKRQVSTDSSILPGLGALNIVGILKIKYKIEKNKE